MLGKEKKRRATKPVSRERYETIKTLVLTGRVSVPVRFRTPEQKLGILQFYRANGRYIYKDGHLFLDDNKVLVQETVMKDLQNVR